MLVVIVGAGLEAGLRYQVAATGLLGPTSGGDAPFPWRPHQSVQIWARSMQHSLCCGSPGSTVGVLISSGTRSRQECEWAAAD